MRCETKVQGLEIKNALRNMRISGFRAEFKVYNVRISTPVGYVDMVSKRQREDERVHVKRHYDKGTFE